MASWLTNVRRRSCSVQCSMPAYGVDERIAESGLDAFAEALALAKSAEVRARVEKASIVALRAALEPVW
jgi:hypothetical protein